jgi:hypothetical protein
VEKDAISQFSLRERVVGDAAATHLFVPGQP